MKVIDNETTKEYEIGLFEDAGWEDAILIRLLELPLVFGEMGTHVGFLEVGEGDDEVGIRYSLDLDAVRFFKLHGRCEDIWYSPEAALKYMIRSSPRFRAALEPDKIEA